MLIAHKKPFLEYLLEWLKTQEIEDIIFAIGFKGEVIRRHFKNNYHGLKILYSHEGNNLLGTGGAIKKALTYCNKNAVFVVNGDTYFPVDLKELLSYHMTNNSEITIALKNLYNFDRYGSVEVTANGIIKSFREKGFKKEGLINGGIYCIEKEILSDGKENAFSFERDFLENHVKDIKIFGKIFDETFYDIGTPADYRNFSEVMSHV